MILLPEPPWCHHTYLNLELVLNKRERHRSEPPSQLLGELALEEECSIVPSLRELCLYTAALLAGIILKRRDAERVRAMLGRSIWQGFLWGTPGQGSSEACHGAVPPIILHSQERDKTACEEMGLAVDTVPRGSWDAM